MRPADIAKKLNISTSSLRYYESRKMIPATKRGENNYRVYEDIHIAYFECIVAMKDGFGLQFTEKVMKKLQNGEITDVLQWINEAQVALFEERKAVEQRIEKLFNLQEQRKELTIGELAEATGVSTSAIRHWEKEGLIQSVRHQGNDYRLFNQNHVRQILLIQMLNVSTWFLDEKRSQLEGIEMNDRQQLERVARQATDYLQYKMTQQMRGIHGLYLLCDKLKLI